MKIYTKVLSELEQAAKKALVDTAKEVLRVSREKVPVDDGTLRRSGRVISSGLDVAVRYSAGHAWLIHERTEWAHPNGGQAKYLEAALTELDLQGMITAGVKQVFGGG